MIKIINFILRNHLAWIKNDLFLLVGLNFLAFIIFYIVKPHYLIQVVALAIMFIKCNQFIKLYSIVPSIASSGDRFSWKIKSLNSSNSFSDHQLLPYLVFRAGPLER